jgi:hypothetical protein
MGCRYFNDVWLALLLGLVDVYTALVFLVVCDVVWRIHVRN